MLIIIELSLINSTSLDLAIAQSLSTDKKDSGRLLHGVVVAQGHSREIDRPHALLQRDADGWEK